MTDYAEANISTEQSSSCQDPRFSRPYGHEEWPAGAQATSCEGPQASDAVTLLNGVAGALLIKQTHLRSPAEFRRVYAGGTRFHGHLVIAFALPNGLGHHRFGITASRKAVGNAVERNRAKRLLRETFRLSTGALEALDANYDWVLNARRALLDVKLKSSLEDFQMIIKQAAERESRSGSIEARQ
jgi:ribonuclease P protein component